ncbi:MAG: FAD-binding oxidoreductase, partial [Myxococcota bacterium]
LAECRLPEPGLPAALLDGLREDTAADRVRTDEYERAFHARGKSYPDLVRLRAGDVTSAPDAVVYPTSNGEVLAVLARCAEAGVAVVPFGGGSSVVGGVDGIAGPEQTGCVSLDVTRMKQLLQLDTTSHTATFQAGIYGPDLERALGARGYTLGHYPQSFEFSTLGGWIAARGAGQQSNRYGAADAWLVAAELATPTGSWRTVPVPHSAAGPNLNELVAGSEGTLGVITEATVKVHEVPEARDYRAYLFRSFAAGAAAIRRIVQAELPVAMMRLSDADETHFFGSFRALLEPPGTARGAAERGLSVAGFGEGRCALLVGLEGDTPNVRHAKRMSAWLCAREGGLPVGAGPGESWYARRFTMPYLRDPLLDRGVAVDTLETATSWSNLPRLYEAVRTALRGALGPRAAILAHISHSYADGASLYFTFLFAQERGAELAQWQRVKDAASEAILGTGGTISHHHGVGRDHRPWFDREKGPLGVAMLRAAKAEVDPKGVLNPGKLV